MILLAPTALAEGDVAPAKDGSKLEQVTKLHQEIVSISQQIWTQLAAISNKQQADAAADDFEAKAARLTELDQELQAMEQDKSLGAPAQEAMAKLAPLVIESYVMMGAEFSALFNRGCFDSQSLQDAFDEALHGGFFFISHCDDQPMDLPTLTPEEELIELARIKQLAQPDQLAHRYLCQVTSPSTAKLVSIQLLEPIAQLHKLRPQGDMGLKPFSPQAQQAYTQLLQPLEQSLWGIRSEYVRIASSFAPDSEDFNNLANTLDELYLSLEETHARFFTTVFDESFLNDMDEAYASHAQTAQNDTFTTQP